MSSSKAAISAVKHPFQSRSSRLAARNQRINNEEKEVIPSSALHFLSNKSNTKSASTAPNDPNSSSSSDPSAPHDTFSSALDILNSSGSESKSNSFSSASAYQAHPSKSAAPLAIPDKQQFCIDMLVHGYVNSFVDFFYLTHRPEEETQKTATVAAAKSAEPAAPPGIDPSTSSTLSASSPDSSNSASPSSSRSPPPLPLSSLPSLQSWLTSAEESHRHGDSSTVFSSYSNLAEYFHSTLQDFKTAIYFYEKCLDISESIGDKQKQCEANIKLGKTHQQMGDLASAIEFFEKYLALARIMEEEEKKGVANYSQNAHDNQTDSESSSLLSLKSPLVRQREANRDLVSVYLRYAEQHESRSLHSSAVLLYKKCLSSAVSCGDLRSEGIATYRLGMACAASGDRSQSIDYQQRYLNICRECKDEIGEGEACAALAESFRELGEIKLAISYLEKYYAIAVKNKLLLQQAQACGSLGAIYSRANANSTSSANSGENETETDSDPSHPASHSIAVNYFEKAFEIAKTVGDRKLIDSARINLGMARGNLSMNKFMGVVKGDLPSLLNWKTRRIPFKEAKRNE